MSEKLSKNVIVNIAKNYEYRYRVYELYNELIHILKFRGHQKFVIFKLLCRHLGRILYFDDICFEAELNYKRYRALVEDIEKIFLVRVNKRKKYSDDGDVYITL